MLQLKLSFVLMCQNEIVFSPLPARGLVFHEKCCGKQADILDYLAVVIYGLCSSAAQSRVHEEGLWRRNAGTGSGKESG